MKWLVTFVMAFFIGLPYMSPEAAAIETIEVGEVRSLGEEVKVPVTIFHTRYITSGQLTVKVPSSVAGVQAQKFEPTTKFNGELFRTVSSIVNDVVTIDFQSQTAKEQDLKELPTIIGYIHYTVSSEFTDGQSVPLEITSVVAKGRNNADLLLKPLYGKIERKVAIGDAIGKNEPTAASAMRILQHIRGNVIADRETLLAADVDKDGLLTQNDAQYILDYVTGKRSNFLAVEAQTLDTAVLKSEYAEKIEAFHGRAPYTFKGTLPSGLKLNVETGEITGTPTSAKSYVFTVRVTDALDNEAERVFSMDVIDANISSVEKLQPINVKVGETPALPNQVTVTYKDKTTSKEAVQWETIDTSKIGTVTARGTLGNTGFKVNVVVNVVNANYIEKITTKFIPILNFYTMTVNVNPEVYTVTISDAKGKNTLNAIYNGDNQFSVSVSEFKGGSTIMIKAYDKYGNLLETKVQPLIAR